MLTIETIRTAQRGDTAAVSAVIAAMDRRVRALARRADRALADELYQEGRIAVWQALERFSGETADDFAGYAYASAKGVISDARRRLAYQGVSPGAAKHFELALRRTGGDVAAAERLVCSAEMEPWRMTPDTARAARMAHQGATSLPTGLAGAERSEGPTARSEVTRRRVGYSLATLGKQQRAVLVATYGLDGDGVADDREIARSLNLTRTQVINTRAKARRRFAEAHAMWVGVAA